MGQAARRQPVHHRDETDLHLFEYIEALNPARWLAAFRSLHPRVRWLMVVLTSSLVLLVGVYGLTWMAINHLEATQGPFLYEALKAPYNLEALPALPADATLDMILPVVMGEFVLQQPEAAVDPAQIVEAAPADTTVVEPAPAAEGAPVEAVPAEPVVETPNNPLTACLILPADGVPICETTFFTQEVFSGSYMRPADTSMVEVVVARFNTHEEASSAIKELFIESKAKSHLGDFALGTGPTDFFFAQSGSTISLTWTNDFRIYTVSGLSLIQVEAMVKALP